MNCNDTKTFLSEWYKMCKCFMDNDNEKYCPVGVGCGACRLLAITEPEKMIKIVQEWSDQHPVRTRLSVLKEHFPNYRRTESGAPYACVRSLYDIKCPYTPAPNTNDCMKCWNTPIEDSKCSSYVDGETPRCIGTKEIDICSCGGDKSKCDFYQQGVQ